MKELENLKEIDREIEKLNKKKNDIINKIKEKISIKVASALGEDGLFFSNNDFIRFGTGELYYFELRINDYLIDIDTLEEIKISMLLFDFNLTSINSYVDSNNKPKILLEFYELKSK